MKIITFLGVVSLLFVIAFTYRAAMKNTGTGQTPRGAIVEAWVNIIIGFSINFVANLLMLPLLGASFTAGENFWLGWTYTAISLVRQFVIRRYFNAKLTSIAKRI